jgi:predicted RNA-binding Zn-ribbon protein involved in translation (DUF1610 family)/DNA-directed RNA polymerase subunit RPC12/RpoP
MGLRCLIGHDYGEPQTSRDRTERGKEVVVTVTEYRECTRCGHRRVISENKEVKAESTDAKASEAKTSASFEGDDSEPAPVAPNDSSSMPQGGTGHDESVTAAEDDGVILPDEPESMGRQDGEWPEAELDDAEAPAEEHEPWPNADSEPEPPEPQEPEPPSPDEDPLDVESEMITVGAAESEAEPASVERSNASSAGSGHPRPDNRDTEFVCPDCGESWLTQNASLRSGDICPECHRGYLDERIVQ